MPDFVHSEDLVPQAEGFVHLHSGPGARKSPVQRVFMGAVPVEDLVVHAGGAEGEEELGWVAGAVGDHWVLQVPWCQQDSSEQALVGLEGLGHTLEALCDDCG